MTKKNERAWSVPQGNNDYHVLFQWFIAAVIRRYVDHQERVDKGKIQLEFEF